jgi:hypothetical protein
MEKEIIKEVFEDINLTIAAIVSNRDRLMTLLKKVVKDSRFPLEYRWDIFLKAGNNNLIETDYRFLPRGIDWDKFNLENDFDLNKFETYTVEDILRDCN